MGIGQIEHGNTIRSHGMHVCMEQCLCLGIMHEFLGFILWIVLHDDNVDNVDNDDSDDGDDVGQHLQPTKRRSEAKRNLMQTLTIHNECGILFGRIRLGLFSLGHLNRAMDGRQPSSRESIIKNKPKK